MGPNVTFYFPGFRSGPRHFESQRRQPCICLKLMTSVWSCSCDPLSSFYFPVLSAGAVKPILPNPSSSCQANTLSCGSRSHTVKLFVPGIELQAASHNSHRYILRALYPMPLFESQAVVKLQLYTQADVLFSRRPGRARSVFSCAAICIIFSGLDASTPPPPPPPPLDPLVRLVLLVPLVLAAVVKLLFPGWRSSIPALAKKIVFSRRSGSILARRCAQVKYLVPGFTAAAAASSSLRLVLYFPG